MPKGKSNYWDIGPRQRRRRLNCSLIAQQLARAKAEEMLSDAVAAKASTLSERHPPSDTTAVADFGEIEVDRFIASPVGESPLPLVDTTVDFSFLDDPDEEDIYSHGVAFWGLDESEDSWANYDDVLLTEEFAAKLGEICIRGTISQSTLSAILKLLQSEVPLLQKLPKDARTLLRTPKDTGTKLVSMDPGHYYHFGLEDALINLFEAAGIEPPAIIELSINTDGLPLFKSPRSEFWPILDSTFNVPQLFRNVFVIGLYYGPKKPLDFDAFIKQTVDDCNKCFSEGLVINGINVKAQVKILPFDAPAKASVMGIKNCNAHFACMQRKCEGFTINHRTYFPGTKFAPRTHAEFIALIDEDFQNRRSYMINLKGVDFIDAVVCDYMHAMCLGCMKKLIGFWIVCPQADKRFKLNALKIAKVSERLMNITSSCSNPSDLGRPPRGFDEIGNFKVVEYRTLLIYTLPAVLKRIVSNEVYNNFILLHTAITILASPKYCFSENIDVAEQFLVRFVETYTGLYGKEFISYNVHNLLHLPNFCRKHGPLDKFSVFKYENKLGTIKNFINEGSQALQQGVNRIIENGLLPPIIDDVSTERNFKHSWSFGGVDLEGLALKNPCMCSQYRVAECSQFWLRCGSLKDSCCGLEDGSVIVIESLVFDGDSLWIAGRALRGKKSIYSQPFKSKHMGSHAFSSLSDTLVLNSVKEVSCKYFVYKVETNFYAYPLHHSFLL